MSRSKVALRLASNYSIEIFETKSSSTFSSRILATKIDTTISLPIISRTPLLFVTIGEILAA